MSAAANRMAAKVAESATKAAGKAAQAGSSAGGGQKGKETVLQKGAKRDPELYVGNLASKMTSDSLPDKIIDPTHHHDGCFRTCWLSFWYAKYEA